MASNPALTRYDRKCRHERIIAAYAAGASSRTVAEKFGMSDSHTRAIIRAHGVMRTAGRPRTAIKTERQRCCNCRYWIGDTCRRRAPVVGTLAANWPSTVSDMWCGEWSQAWDIS